MSNKKLLETSTGIVISDTESGSVSIISVDGVPGASGLSANVAPGTLAIARSDVTEAGKMYMKVASGSGTDKWEEMVNAQTLADSITGSSLFDFKDSVNVATDAPLPAVTAAGSKVGKTLTADAVGALTVDGYAVALNDRILVKDQVNAVDNGIYVVTTLGDGSTAFVLTRSEDHDDSPTQEVTGGALTIATDGTSNANTQFILIATGDVDVDVDPQNWSIFNKLGGLSALQAEVDAIETSLGSAINADGTFAGYTGTNFLDTATDYADADIKLDTKLGANPTANVRTNSPIAPSNSTHANIEALDDAIGVDSQLTPEARTKGPVSLSNSVYANIDSIDDGIGPDADLTPEVRTAGPVANSQSLKSMVDSLDTAIGADLTPVSRTQNATQAALDVNSNIQQLDSAIGSDAAMSSQNYISTSNTVYRNLSNLDSQLQSDTERLNEVDTRLHGTTTGGIGYETVDSVLCDDMNGARWEIMVRETANPASLKKITVHALHNGHAAADASDVDSSDSNILKFSGAQVTGFDYQVILVGSGLTQTMQLQVESNLGLDFEIVRTSQTF